MHKLTKEERTDLDKVLYSLHANGFGPWAERIRGWYDELEQMHFDYGSCWWTSAIMTGLLLSLIIITLVKGLT